MLNENQHRLLMCCRIAKALDKGEIYLDATGPRMFWRLEKDERTINVFHSIDEMECYLEHLLESRNRTNRPKYGTMDSSIKRRTNIIYERHESRMTGKPMLFQSQINK